MSTSNLNAGDRYAQEILRSYQRVMFGGVTGSEGMPPIQLPRPISPNVTAEPETNPNGDTHAIGGRLWTKTFSGAGAGINDYYDRGAMRFPKIPVMAPTFALLEYLEITEKNGLQIPYVMSDPQGSNLNNFNNKTLTTAELEASYKAEKFDPFGTGVQGLTASPANLVLKMIQPLKNDVRLGITDNLFKVDGMSARDYMTSGAAPGGTKYSDDLVTYLETFSLGTNMYDTSIAEIVIEAVNFDYYDGAKTADWVCIQGGGGVIASKMAEKIPKKNFQNGMRVTALAPVTSGPQVGGVSVTCGQSASPAPVTYDHVITTVPLSCLRTVDMTAYEPNWKLSTALRTLSYGPSTKIGIRFKTRWWENLANLSTTGVGNQLGGVTATDRPTRVVVYPSYGIGSTTGASMVVSYTWSQDALRLGALCQGKGSPQEEVLKNLILQDLAAIHGLDPTWLAGQVEEFDAWAWYNHENSAGAFAWFNPGQFSDLYTQVTQPLLGTLHFAGEATSVHHGWMVGSIDSAFRALAEIGVHEKNRTIRDELPKLWPEIQEFDQDILERQVLLGQNR